MTLNDQLGSSQFISVLKRLSNNPVTLLCSKIIHNELKFTVFIYLIRNNEFRGSNVCWKQKANYNSTWRELVLFIKKGLR